MIHTRDPIFLAPESEIRELPQSREHSRELARDAVRETVERAQSAAGSMVAAKDNSRRLDARDLDLPTTTMSEISGELSFEEKSSELVDRLNQLARLVANVTDAYTAAIFLADMPNETVHLAAVHTLSREVVPQARIGFGCGLVGWTAENAVRISVCPFEHDSSTLLYYSRDQALKSFTAVPILDSQNQLLGVISCDSKKSYAFAKVTEKILLDCANQAAAVISMHRRITSADKSSRSVNEERLTGFLESLRAEQTERGLLERASALPIEFVERDALVVITTDEPGSSAASFYSPSNQVRVGHRLLELVCRHKKVICGERSVQAQTVDDSKQRSFLSIPFHISKREAGSINLLSGAFEAFSAVEISTLERVAKIVGSQLELLRLREKFMSPEAATGLLSYQQFAKLAKNAFPERTHETRPSKQAFSLIRLALTNVAEIEDFMGADTAQRTILKLMRLVEQAKGSSAIAGYLYGSQLLILSEAAEGSRIMGRLKRLLERFSLSEENTFEVGNRERFERARSQPGVKLHDLIARGLRMVSVNSPADGENLDELLAKSNRLLELTETQAASGKSLEVIAHASNW